MIRSATLNLDDIAHDFVRFLNEGGGTICEENSLRSVLADHPIGYNGAALDFAHHIEKVYGIPLSVLVTQEAALNARGSIRDSARFVLEYLHSVEVLA